MATQSDLDKMRKKLSDLDAKLKSMRGNFSQRNPNFDSAIANQNFKNSMAEQRARMEADRVNRRMAPNPPPKQGQFTQGRLMGAPTNQPAQSRVPMGFSTYEEAGIPPEQAKILDDEMAKMQSENAAGAVEQQNMKKAGAFTIGGTPDKPIYGSIVGPVYDDGSLVNATNQQMQNYQNFLRQGMQNSNTMNQGAMTDFANMQAGAPTTQPTIPLPQLRGVTAQPRNLPRPRQPKGFGNPIGRSAF